MRIEDSKIRACLINSIDEGLKVADADLIESFNNNLELVGLAKADVPDKLEMLCAVLENTFGTNAFTVHRAIAREFYATLGLSFEPFVGKNLIKYVADAKVNRDDQLPGRSR